MEDEKAALNTDRELWREEDSYYAPSLFVTEGGGIGVNVGGLVIVKPVRAWHSQEVRIAELEAENGRLRGLLSEIGSISDQPFTETDEHLPAWIRTILQTRPDYAFRDGVNAAREVDALKDRK